MTVDTQKLRELFEILEDDSAEGQHFDAARKIICALPALLAEIERKDAEVARLRALANRPALNAIVDEIHRRADKEWADNGYDFTVTVTAEDYRDLCSEEAALSHSQADPTGVSA